LALLIERLSRALRPRTRPRLQRVEYCRELRLELKLDERYYLARGSRGAALIPKDEYMELVEEILLDSARKGYGDG